MNMSPLKGARILVVEDEYFIAADLVRVLEAEGVECVGPVGSIDHARELLARENVEAAVLDLNLHGEMAFPLVRELRDSGTPCVIMTGYSPETLPEWVRQVPSLEKPVDYNSVVHSLESQITARAT